MTQPTNEYEVGEKIQISHAKFDGMVWKAVGRSYAPKSYDLQACDAHAKVKVIKHVPGEYLIKLAHS